MTPKDYYFEHCVHLGLRPNHHNIQDLINGLTNYGLQKDADVLAKAVARREGMTTSIWIAPFFDQVPDEELTLPIKGSSASMVIVDDSGEDNGEYAVLPKGTYDIRTREGARALADHIKAQTGKDVIPVFAKRVDDETPSAYGAEHVSSGPIRGTQYLPPEDPRDIEFEDEGTTMFQVGCYVNTPSGYGQVLRDRGKNGIDVIINGVAYNITRANVKWCSVDEFVRNLKEVHIGSIPKNLGPGTVMAIDPSSKDGDFTTELHLGPVRLNFRQLQEEHYAWVSHNFPEQLNDPTRKDDGFDGLVEEVGELARARLKRRQGIRGTKEEWDAQEQDALADAIVVITSYCNAHGIDLQTVVEKTWNEVKKRDWIKYPKTGVPPAAHEEFAEFQG